jgi:hypothetical protein
MVEGNSMFLWMLGCCFAPCWNEEYNTEGWQIYWIFPWRRLSSKFYGEIESYDMTFVFVGPYVYSSIIC